MGTKGSGYLVNMTETNIYVLLTRIKTHTHTRIIVSLFISLKIKIVSYIYCTTCYSSSSN